MSGTVTVIGTATSGAVQYDSNLYPTLRPANIVSVYGLAGLKLIATVSNGAQIVEELGGTTHNFALDSTGKSIFHIVSPVAYNDGNKKEQNLLSETINITTKDNLPITANPVIFSFYNYPPRDRKLLTQSLTTGAPNDGATPCTLNVLFDKRVDGFFNSITKIFCIVNNSAIIQNFGGTSQSGEIQLNSDGTATINIVDTVSENVKITISLPESPDGDIYQFNCNFIQKPF